MISAVIVAGGKGKRMGQAVNKQFIMLCDKEILAHTIGVFQRTEIIDEIIVVVGENEVEYCTDSIINKYGFNKVKRVVAGGDERKDSVFNGLMNCNKKTEIVVIHDGARPFIDEDIIINSVECADTNGACTVAVPVKDTIKVVDKNMVILNTPDRSTLYSVQTPQTFRYELIVQAHKNSNAIDKRITDDTMLVEAQGHMVKVVEGNYFNIKITTPEDLVLGEAILDYINKGGNDKKL